jgi:hypothetical protein
MSKSDLLDNIKYPSFYGKEVNSVKILQTHISYVALTGKYAYKIKKPVNFGFLDFSSLEKRKHFCEEELRLNRRLSPEIYLDVIPITKQKDKLTLNGEGEIVEYALKMKEFPQEQIMSNLLKKGKINEEIIEKLCRLLVVFYKNFKNSKEINNYGKLESVKQNIDENFEQTESMIGKTIPKQTFDFIKSVNSDFFKRNKSIFEKRVDEGFIKDCHGDLHSGNIVVTKKDKIIIFDCIEFNKRFRFIDAASDIGFLAMDLDYLNWPYLSSFLIKSYMQKINDNILFEILNFYKSYRAYVRGKVTGFALQDKSISETENKKLTDIAKKYFELSKYYASLISIQINTSKPILFVVSGMTGTGKSTLSGKIAVDYNAFYLNTDIVRKEIEGIDKFEKHYDKPNTGLYSPEKINKIYKSVIEKASEILKQGKNVVIDATFQKRNHRDMANKIAEENNAIFLSILCTCPDSIAKKWLDERLKKKTVSDGRWEIYLSQKKTFENYLPSDTVISVDMSDKSYNYRSKIFEKIQNFIKEAI